ncbi:MAG: hypothetical protein ABIP79_09465 [Chitinophagaceae bacterium]
MNWYLVIPLVVVIFSLLVLLIRQNMKDDKEIRNKLNNDYRNFKKRENIDMQGIE